MQTHAALPMLTLFVRAHALWMLIAAAVSLALGPWVAAAGGVLSLGAFVAMHRGRWTPSGRLGAANALTLFRLMLVSGVAAFGARPPGPDAALLVLAIFTLDGLDGWIARRTGEASIFGACLDMECDALLVLLCSLVLYQHERLPVFILFVGLLRYLYVVVLMAAPVAGGETPHTRLGRYGFSLLMVSLMASLWPLEPLHRPLALVTALVLLYSFGLSLRAVFRPA